jgi:hypothetical protein
MGMIAELPEADRAAWCEKAKSIAAQYDALSDQYQEGKGANDIPLN